MIMLADLIGALSHYVEAQRQLAACRATAKGDVDYYSYSYMAEMDLAEQALAKALNGYIGQRVAEEIKGSAVHNP